MDIVIDSYVQVLPEHSQPIHHEREFYSRLLVCLGYSQAAPPVASLLKQLHGLEGHWLVVSPIHWQASHNDAMVLAIGADLHLSDAAGRAFFDAFAEFVAPENLPMFYHDPTTWLIQVDKAPPIHAKPLGGILHQSMMPEIESLDKTLFWQRFLTESQMFLSQHALNRLYKNQYLINGIWIWGAGELKAPSHRLIVVNHDKIVPLAKLLSTQNQRYSQEACYPKDALLIWQDGDHLVELQEKFKHRSVDWHWNNQAYRLKPKSWLRRIAEKLHVD